MNTHDTGAPTPLQQAIPALVAAAIDDRAELAALLTEIADLIEHTAAVRQRLTERLAADDDLYKDALRVLLAPTVPNAQAVLDVLGELTRQSRQPQSSQATSTGAAAPASKDGRP